MNLSGRCARAHALLLLAGVAACVDLPDDEPALGATAAALTFPDEATSPFVRIDTSSRGCSGALLTNGWIITAGACVASSIDQIPYSVLTARAGQIQTAYETVLSLPAGLALLRVSGYPVDNRSTGFQHVVDRTPAADGQILQCVGYTAVGGPLRPRTFDAQILDVSGSMIEAVADHEDLLPTARDVGAGCFRVDASGQRRLHGVVVGVSVIGQFLRRVDIQQVLPFVGWMGELRTTKVLQVASSGMCLQAGLFENDGVTQQPCNANHDLQKWRFDAASSTTMRIRNRVHGLCLQAAGTIGGRWTMRQCNRSSILQEVELVPQLDPARFVIRRVVGQTCATVSGATLVEASCVAAAEQTVTPLVEGEDGGLAFVDVAGGRCADVPGAAGGQTNLQQYPCNGGTNQLFRLARQAAGVVALQPHHAPAMCLDIPWGAPDPSFALQQFPCHFGTAQRWRLGYRAGGRYTLVNVASTLGAFASPAGNGQAIRQTQVLTSTAAQWRPSH